MLDDTLENILREIGVVAQRSPLEAKLLEQDQRTLYLSPNYFNEPIRDEVGEVCFLCQPSCNSHKLKPLAYGTASTSNAP